MNLREYQRTYQFMKYSANLSPMNEHDILDLIESPGSITHLHLYRWGGLICFILMIGCQGGE